MSKKSQHDNAAELFDYFYLVHYQLNMGIEDVMRGSLPRKEAALLLLLHAEGGKKSCLPRKLIVDRFASWFEATSSNVTKIITKLASSTPSLVKVTNEPGSARDKQISLTTAGKTTLRAMLKRGAAQSEHSLGGLAEEDLKMGLEFFKKASAYTGTLIPLQKLGTTPSKNKPK